MLNEGPLSVLPWFALDPAWIEQSAAFADPDPRMGCAYIRLLLAAWRGAPAGTVPSTHRYLAQVTGLEADVVAQRWSVLTEGFTTSADGRLHHERMERLAQRLADRYGKDLEEFTLSAAMTIQDPEHFALVAPEAARGTARGKRSLPRGFGYEMFPQLRHWCAAQGYPRSQDQDWVMSRFIDYATARGEHAKDWCAAFRLWAAREFSYGRKSSAVDLRAPSGFETIRLNSGTPMSAATTVTRGERARANNAAAFGLTCPTVASPHEIDAFERDGREPSSRGVA